MEPQTTPQKTAITSRYSLTIKRALPLACLLAAGSASAQWSGDGAGGTGTDLNDTGNWTSGDANGSFVNNTTDATLTLSDAETTFDSFDFDWGTANNLTISGDGTGDNEIIHLNGDIEFSRATGTSTVSISDDVTLDLGSLSTTRLIQYGSTGDGGTTNLVIDALITGTNAGGGSLYISYNSIANPIVYLTNDNNTFDVPINSAGNLLFTTIGDVGGGASSLGAPSTVANGTITTSSRLTFIGTTDQSSDRNISLSYHATIANYSETAAKLDLSGTISKGARYLHLESATGNVLEISGTITGSSTGDVRINWDSGDLGTVLLSGTNNSYAGATLIRRGTLEVASLADGGVNSSIGASTSDASNLTIREGTLRYVGSGNATTDRLFTVNTSGKLDVASDAGTVSFTNTGEVSVGAGVFTLSASNAGVNTFAANLTGTGQVIKAGSGTWSVTGTSGITGQVTISEGTLSIDGDYSSTSGIQIASGATLAGSGVTSAIQGSGLVAPGNSPGILTAPTIDFSDGLDIALEMSQIGEATWSSASASGNDVLHLTDATTPILTAADSDNVISLYFSGSGTYIGGIFTDSDSDFTSLIASATYAYYLADESGSIVYNGITYSEMSSADVSMSIVQIASADFASGTVLNGWTGQYVVVPEPSHFACVSGILLGALVLRRRHEAKR